MKENQQTHYERCRDLNRRLLGDPEKILISDPETGCVRLPLNPDVFEPEYVDLHESHCDGKCVVGEKAFREHAEKAVDRALTPLLDLQINLDNRYSGDGVWEGFGPGEDLVINIIEKLETLKREYSL